MAFTVDYDRIEVNGVEVDPSNIVDIGDIRMLEPLEEVFIYGRDLSGAIASSICTPSRSFTPTGHNVTGEFDELAERNEYAALDC